MLAATEATVSFRTGAAQRIELDGGEAIGVRVDDELVRADHVVLATGAVDAPLLLWRSGIEHPAVGRRLCFHPVLTTQVVLDDGAPPIGDDDPLPRLGIPPTPEHPWFTMVLRDTNPLPVDALDQDVPPHRLVEIQAFGPIDPHPDNRLWVDDRGRARFDVPIRPADRERLAAIERDVAELIDALGRVRRGCEPRWSTPDIAHLMGSCRMGDPDDATSVVDVHGRLHGVGGLDVVGNAVLSTRLAVNPTLTAVALALHGRRAAAGLGAHRRSRWGSDAVAGDDGAQDVHREGERRRLGRGPVLEPPVELLERRAVGSRASRRLGSLKARTKPPNDRPNASASPSAW